jgi:hypothetical protein
MPTTEQIRSTGITPLQAIAAELMRRQIRTSRGSTLLNDPPSIAKIEAAVEEIKLDLGSQASGRGRDLVGWDIQDTGHD